MTKFFRHQVPLATILVSLWFSAGIYAAPRDEMSSSRGWQALGGSSWQSWKGVRAAPSGEAATLTPGETAVFTYSDGPRGAYKHGFRFLNDSTADWRGYYGVRFEVKAPGDCELEAGIAAQPGLDLESPIVAPIVLAENQEWRTVTLPWSAFRFQQAKTSFLKYVKQLRISTKGGQEVQLRNVCLIKAPRVALETEVHGKSVPQGAVAEYPVKVINCTEEPQKVVLGFVDYGWQEMTPEVEPASLDLAPGASAEVMVRVAVSERVPPGGNERQVLQVIANGEAAHASKLELITTSRLPHPYVLHTPARWEEVRAKVAKYDWAKSAQESYVKLAREWKVPEAAQPPHNDPDDTMGPFLFRTQEEHNILAAGIAYQLTGNVEFAEKAALFLKRLSDPANGYAKTFRACNQSLVQEGHFFQHMAMAYDMILPSGALGEPDQARIETTFRLLMETMNRANDGGNINNWNLSELCGAFYCALVLQDLAAAERFFSGPNGIKDQLAKGTMDDGWWYECSISYNVWCASEFTQVALAYEPFGKSFRHERVPASFVPNVPLALELSGGAVAGVPEDERRKPFGMNAEVFGPARRPFRTITDLWDSLLPFLDYRGVMFGVNDSTENQVVGTRKEVGAVPFELAYYVYRDPRYAAIVQRGLEQGGARDLLYGVPELPENLPRQYRESAYADNVGLAMLRSRSRERPIREQIQAVLHYGTHGWAHGHFDRTNLLHLSRYGRSFYNPEMVWYGYEPFMYKFYVQTSVSKNMVTVDQKMQEATPGRRVLWHTGNLMQAAVVDTVARWSNPPYGGMVYDYVPVTTFEEKTWREGRHVPIPGDKERPRYGSLTEFSEPIFQRRLMVVTDDYVVLADYIKGEQPHTYESLFQMKGFQGLKGAGQKLQRHEAQWNPEPVGSAQFVTDCSWYGLEAPSLAQFEMRFGPGADNAGTRAPYSEDGVLKLDVHTLWPRKQEVMIATAPEDHGVNKRLFYKVSGDDLVLAEGKFGAWILGQAEIDVPLDGMQTLSLETRTELASRPTLFWGNARLLSAEGKEIPLSTLKERLSFENVVEALGPGRDYFGGPIKLGGREFSEATPGEPSKASSPGRVKVNLAGLGAVRFKATLAGDYPLGNEAQRRKTMAIRQGGTEARFLTLIEPYEAEPQVKFTVAESPDKLRVELKDGRVHEIDFNDFATRDESVRIRMRELHEGQVPREEATSR